MMASTDVRPVNGSAPARAVRLVDFQRPLTCILGLPFDAIDVAQAVQRIRESAFSGLRCFVSTPNLNFAMTARTDAAFRGSVLRSDLSLVDGMPLVWIARLTGVSLPGRVSGADVFDALIAHAGPPLSVFLFGGPPGAAALAALAINRRGGGLRCVGHDEAGYGNVEAMSDDERIERINRSGAQFLVVALGAGKGQAWIEHNAHRLNVPVLSHLGAVVNFVAGTVRRAPRWMQVCGIEWLWRIREEPVLWQRYLRDGADAVSVVARRVVPDAVASMWWRWVACREALPPVLESRLSATGHGLALVGDWRSEAALASLRAALSTSAAEAGPIEIDLARATGLGSAATALLLVARGWFEGRGGIAFTGITPSLREMLDRQLALAALLGPDA